MKRLLAAGSGSIYQINKVFRSGERGKRHNPEFTMLEWYRVGFDHHQLMWDVESLVMETVGELRQFQETERLSYAEAFQRYAGIDPHSARTSDLAACVSRHNINVTGLTSNDRDAWENLLMTHVVEPHLGTGPRCTFIYDYPASQAAMARIRAGNPALAERFELYIEGIELANGFHELTNADEQRQRFESDRRRRREQEIPDIPIDDNFLAALRHGLPDCSGVAMGIDRLVMIAANTPTIQDVTSFPFERA